MISRVPALHPGEDHLHEKKIEGGEDEQYQQRPRYQCGLRETQAHQNPEQPDAAERGRRIECAIRQAHQKIRTVAERESQQAGGVRIVGEGGRHDGEDLPEAENCPHEEGERFRLAGGEKEICSQSHEGRAAYAAQGECERYDDARYQFHLAPRGTQRITEKPPAQPGNGCQLAAAMEQDCRFIHDVLSEPGKLLIRLARAANGAQEDFLQRHLFAGRY
jgi:hypothetical protein